MLVSVFSMLVSGFSMLVSGFSMLVSGFSMLVVMWQNLDFSVNAQNTLECGLLKYMLNIAISVNNNTWIIVNRNIVILRDGYNYVMQNHCTKINCMLYSYWLITFYSSALLY